MSTRLLAEQDNAQARWQDKVGEMLLDGLRFVQLQLRGVDYATLSALAQERLAGGDEGVPERPMTPEEYAREVIEVHLAEERMRRGVGINQVPGTEGTIVRCPKCRRRQRIRLESEYDSWRCYRCLAELEVK